MSYHLGFLFLILAGWVNRQQQAVIDYLREENRVLIAQLQGKRLRLSDDDRRRLAVKAKAQKLLTHKALGEVASIATRPIRYHSALVWQPHCSQVRW